VEGVSVADEAPAHRSFRAPADEMALRAGTPAHGAGQPWMRAGPLEVRQALTAVAGVSDARPHSEGAFAGWLQAQLRARKLT
jgi:hypothetical protein